MDNRFTSSNRYRQLVRICNMYYVENLSQKEIADKLHLSRPHVSRLLQTAREEGIVKISIVDYFSEEHYLEKELRSKYNLLDVVVINTDGYDEQDALISLADAMTTLLNASIKNDTIIGVGSGHTVHEVLNNIKPLNKKNIDIVPLHGAFGSHATYYQANANAQLLGERLRSHCWQLNAPAYLTSSVTRNTLLEEPDIKKVLEILGKTSVVVTGILAFPNPFLLSNYQNSNIVEELENQRVSTVVGGIYINADGETVVSKALANKHIGITPESMRLVPKVIAVAYGSEKVRAIDAGLKSGYIDVFLTTTETATALLK